MNMDMESYLTNLPDSFEIVRFLELLPNGRCRVRSADGITLYIIRIDLESLDYLEEELLPGSFVIVNKEGDSGDVMLILEQKHIQRLLLLGKWPRAFIEVDYILKNLEDILYDQTYYGRLGDNTLISWKNF